MLKFGSDKPVYSAVVLMFLLCSFLYGIDRIYGFSIYPDEFGYWASAAGALGYDWSEIASLGSYYSFGYSLVLMPILFLFKDPVMAYRMAVGVNGLLLVFSFFLIRKLLKRLVPETEEKYAVLFAGIAVCYPVSLLYMNMTLSEVMLVFVFVLVCYLLFDYLKTMRLRSLILTALATAYLYVVHMRTVAVAAVVILTVVIRIFSEKREGRRFFLCRMLILALILAAGIGAVGFGKKLVQQNIYTYAGREALAGNDYAGQWGKLVKMFTPQGMGEFFVSLIGKIFYLGMASLGLFYFGMAQVIRGLFDKRKRKSVRLFYFFLLLAVTGQVLVCAVYTKGYGRIDSLLYGRYDEYILPFVMALGCMYLLKQKHPVRLFCGIILSGIPAVMLLEHVIVKYHMTNIHGGYFIAGMSYLLNYIDFQPENYFWKAFLLSAVLCLILFGIFLLIRKKQDFVWLLCAVIGMECLLGLSLGEKYTFKYSTVAYADGRLAGQLSEMCGEQGRRIVSFGNDSADNFISSIQFALRDKKIYLVGDEAWSELRERDLVIVSGAHGEEDELLELYAQQEAYGSFWLYYNE